MPECLFFEAAARGDRERKRKGKTYLEEKEEGERRVMLRPET